MPDEEREPITAKDITRAVREGQDNWFLKLFWNPAAVGFLTMLVLIILGFLMFLGNSEQGEDVMRFLSHIIDAF